MITVTKPFFPPLEEYIGYLESIWKARQLTNHGPLVQKLERDLAARFDVPHVQFVANGTLALHLALRALDVRKEVITTPFSFVATTTAILWEHCEPKFVDVEEDTFCIDPRKVEAAITPNTEAILATHVYGNPCDVVALQAIADKHNLRVIYDGAHAFGTLLRGLPVVHYGDVTTLSFHATKLFHTVEGGALVMKNDDVAKNASLLRTFGAWNDEYYFAGTNAKASELHAAMGLCMLPRVDDLIRGRREICLAYDARLQSTPLQFARRRSDVTYNYAYYPVVFPTEEALLRVRNALASADIGTRRYFHPSLNRLPYVRGEPCPVSESIAPRVLCLPLYAELTLADVDKVADIVVGAL